MGNLVAQGGLAGEIISGGLWQVLLLSYGFKNHEDIDLSIGAAKTKAAEERSRVAKKNGMTVLGGIEPPSDAEDARALSRTAKSLLAGIFGGEDFAGLLREVSGIVGNEEAVREMEFEVLDAQVFEAMLKELAPESDLKQTYAFYSGKRGRGTAYIRKDALDEDVLPSLAKFALHEAVHAYLEGVTKNAVMEESLVLGILGAVLNHASRKDGTDGLRLVAMESILDALLRLKNKDSLSETVRKEGPTVAQGNLDSIIQALPKEPVTIVADFFSAVEALEALKRIQSRSENKGRVWMVVAVPKGLDRSAIISRIGVDKDMDKFITPIELPMPNGLQFNLEQIIKMKPDLFAGRQIILITGHRNLWSVAGDLVHNISEILFEGQQDMRDVVRLLRGFGIPPSTANVSRFMKSFDKALKGFNVQTEFKLSGER